jgi:hypothetical protein
MCCRRIEKDGIRHSDGPTVQLREERKAPLLGKQDAVYMVTSQTHEQPLLGQWALISA